MTNTSPDRRHPLPARRLAVPLAILAALAGCGPAGPAAIRQPPGTAELQRDTRAIAAVGVTGVLARVTGSGRTITAGSGTADIATGAPLAPDGFFRIGSITKTYTATVILQLISEGKMSLNDTVEHWLPGVVAGDGNDGRAITIRELLQNTSGIHDDIPAITSAAQYDQHRYDTYTPAQLVARAMRHRPDFPPGAGWSYSNTGYLLLGMIIQRVTGRSWYQEIKDRILTPLGLRHTFWPGTAPTIPEPHAHAYEIYQAGQRPVDVTRQVDYSAAAGGLVSTTSDVTAFFRALAEGRLLRPAQLAEMRQAVPVGSGLGQLWPGARDGLGIFSRPLPCGGTYWINEGGDGGYITFAAITAGARRAVVISMSTAVDPDQLRQERAADKLIDDALCGKTP